MTVKKKKIKKIKEKDERSDEGVTNFEKKIEGWEDFENRNGERKIKNKRY